MSELRAPVRVLLASVALVSACTTDFTGYHLDSGSAGAASDSGGAVSVSGATGSSSGSGGASDSGGAPGHGGDNGVANGGAPNGGAVGSSDAGGAPSAMPPSCEGLPDTCGPDGSDNCCAASLVPGGAYHRSNLAIAPATVSGFALDDYEVTVGRFRNFVAIFTQAMTPAGAGKNPGNLALDPGWNASWNANLPASSAALSTAVECQDGNYTTKAGPNESQPMTCVNWYEAYAFCIWDGGRLPTESEWNYAAAGGAEERTYPWGSDAPDAAHAVFCPGSCSMMEGVGSKAPTGNGKWGQADLVGNVWEWNLDVYAASYPTGPCQDCANTSGAANSPRVFRGGSSANDDTFLLVASRYSRAPGDHNGFVGVRCARKP